MTTTSCRQISVETTPYYDVIGRCARRAYLSGFDSSSGKDYEHRRQWVIERLELLCSVFAVELCSYAISSNHYHLLVRLAPDHAETWSTNEVMERWEKLDKIATPVEIGLVRDAITATGVPTEELIEVRRQHLTNLSWFMKCLNEHIARRANLEDRCTGSFWDKFCPPATPAYITAM